MKKVAVIGAGSWGTALAISLVSGGHDVRLTTRDIKKVNEMREIRENKKYLPGVVLPPALRLCDTIEEATDDADLVLFVVPTQHFRDTFEKAMPYLKEGMIIVNAAKGIEKGTLLRVSQIAAELRPDLTYVMLSGPSHAEEVSRGLPTTIVAASEDIKAAELVQDVFMTDMLRVYTNDDVVGVELGGALKNIIALGAGISDGIGFGDNAKAALMTRGITEITRLGIALGSKKETFAGLTGVGDLIVTCTSMHSRNRRCGILIGQGMAPDKAAEQIGMVVEGMTTAEAAYALAQKLGIEMPITECIYRCMKGELTAAETVPLLMGRDRKSEN